MLYQDLLEELSQLEQLYSTAQKRIEYLEQLDKNGTTKETKERD